MGPGSIEGVRHSEGDLVVLGVVFARLMLLKRSTFGPPFILRSFLYIERDRDSKTRHTQVYRPRARYKV